MRRILIASWLALVMSLPVSAEPAEATLRVAGMTCEESCAVRVERVLREQPGVLEVEIDYEQARAWIRFEPEVTSAERLAQALEEATKGRFLARPETPGEGL